MIITDEAMVIETTNVIISTWSGNSGAVRDGEAAGVGVGVVGVGVGVVGVGVGVVGVGVGVGVGKGEEMSKDVNSTSKGEAEPATYTNPTTLLSEC